MSKSASLPSFRLTVSAGPATELFVVDSQLNLVSRAIGYLQENLPAGIYKVRSRVGRNETEQMLVLDRDTPVTFSPTPEFSSPAPLFGTSTSHEYQRDAAVALSGKTSVHAGTGASVLLVARWWTSNTAPTPTDNPAEGVSLARWTGEVVIDLQGDGETHAGPGDPLVGCKAELDPGAYVLRRPSPTGSTIEQTIIASPGWQTQVFVLKRLPERSPEPTLHAGPIDEVSVLMSRAGFEPGAEDMRLSELARIALADERRVLSDDLNLMASRKFENPMLGILAGHLLDLSVKRQAADAKATRKAEKAGLSGPVPLKSDLKESDLDVIVRNLRRLLGSDHPDVEALSLRCPDPSLQTRKPLKVAPMLRRSWSLYVAASNDHPRLVPMGLWDRIAKLTTVVPYLAWLPRAADGRDDPALQVARALVGDSSAASFAADAPAAPTTEPASVAVRARAAGSSGRGHLMGILPTNAILLDVVESHAIEVGSVIKRRPSPARPPRMSPSARKSASIAHDIPRAALDRAFKEA